MPDHAARPRKSAAPSPPPKRALAPSPKRKPVPPAQDRADRIRLVRVDFLRLGALATRALAKLEQLDSVASIAARGPQHAAREAIVNDFADQLRERTGALLDRTAAFTDDELRAIRYEANAAASDVLGLTSWVHTRPVNGAMKARLVPLEQAFNLLVAQTGATPTLAQPHPVGPESESREATAEKDQLEEAETTAMTAIDSLANAQQLGVINFRAIVARETIEPPSLLLEIVKGVLVASMGHLAGAFAGRLFALSTDLTEPGATRVIQKMAEVTTDAVQSVGGALVSAAFAESAQESETRRRLELIFATALAKLVDHTRRQQRDAITNAVHAHMITAAELRTTRVTLLRGIPLQTEAYTNSALAGFAACLAQSRLGAARDKAPDGRRVSRVNASYFEERPRPNGVLRLGFTIDPDSQQPTHTGTLLVGMNRDTLEGVVADAGRDVERVWLPKHVDVKMKGVTDAEFAMDERNRVGDSLGWGPFRSQSKYKHPERFWDVARTVVKL